MLGGTNNLFIFALRLLFVQLMISVGTLSYLSQSMFYQYLAWKPAGLFFNIGKLGLHDYLW